jgi:phosphotransferase system enzyme I (PtsP)
VAHKASIHVHHRGDRGVDAILRLIELAGHDGAIETMLTAMCVEIAAITGVDIASVYTRDDDTLVMRGNHGFDAAAVGATVLAVGEGITGLVAECMRPVSAAHASAEAAYKHVPHLGEERFPVFAGVPLISGGAVAGVLVLQRKKRPFAADEVTLATALGAPITLAIERRRASAARSARLSGTPGSPGAVLGRAGIVPTSTALGPIPGELDRALARLRDDLARAVGKLGDAGGATLDRFALALWDRRLRDQLDAAAGRPDGLRAVAKEYARAAYRLGEMPEAVSEIEELCVLIGLAADARSPVRPGAVWVADRIGGFVATIAIARGASALISSDVITPAALELARTAHLPAVSMVSGLFGWARSGDLLAVDGEAGVVLVHPAPSDIERLRRR